MSDHDPKRPTDDVSPPEETGGADAQEAAAGGEGAGEAPPPASAPSSAGKKKPKQWPPEGSAVAAKAEEPGAGAPKKAPKKWPPEAESGAADKPKKAPKKWSPPGPAAADGEGSPAPAAGEAIPPDPTPVWEKDPVPPEWEEAADDELVEELRREHGDAIETARRYAGDLVLGVRREAVREVCATVRDRGYHLLVDITGVHRPDAEAGDRFEVVYIVYSLEANRRVRLKVGTDEATPVPSVVPVWAGANWPEREVYDMFGVRFADHPDMTRILLWEGFQGHPLRKDFPVEGIETGSAIYPEYYGDTAGPVAGTGTGWKPPQEPTPDQGAADE